MLPLIRDLYGISNYPAVTGPETVLDVPENRDVPGTVLHPSEGQMAANAVDLWWSIDRSDSR